EERHVYAADAAERIEAAAGEPAGRAVVYARHVAPRTERRDPDDGGTWPHGREPDGHRAAQRLAERDDACCGERQAVVRRLDVAVKAPFAGCTPPTAGPAVVVGEDPDPAGGERLQDRRTAGDVPGVAVRPDERRRPLRSDRVPGVQLYAVGGREPALP